MESQPAYLRGRGRGRGRGQQNDGQIGRSVHVNGRDRRNNPGSMPNPSGNNWTAPTGNSGMNRTGASQGQVQSNYSKNSMVATKYEEGLTPGNVWASKSDAAKEVSDQSVESRFQDASKKLQQSVQRHVEEFDDVSSEDEDDIADNVLQSIFKSYSFGCEERAGEDMNKAQDLMLYAFRSGTSACLICIENIKKEDAIWSCKGCFCMLHLVCIQKWVKEGVHQHIYQSEENNPNTDIPWFCPKCRFEYKQKDCPKRYYCFCGDEQDPKFDPWLVPHSCGNTCGKKLIPECGHSCLLLCHPGACPPCPKTVSVKCYCGKRPPTVKRCSDQSWSCGQPCLQLMSCGHHNCEQPCHQGECPACPKTSRQKCQCGKCALMRPCADISWQCDEPCGKPLDCGNHDCERICHSGFCGPCPRSGKRKCPCGKTEFDLPCTDDIPTCGDTCDKLLTCELHQCSQRCHVGQCGTCLQMVPKKCRCGQKQREVPCHKEFTCEVKCTQMKDCKKHQCKRKCCDGNCTPCEQTCGKPLTCRNHKCISLCHRGPCYPCPLSVEIYCFCKVTSISVPCGKEKTTKPPRCNLACRTPPDCHHFKRVKHRCHFSDCPPCSQICGKKLVKCAHSCPNVCHSAVKEKKKDNVRRAGPWEGKATIKIQIVNKPCLPCKVPMPIQCLGKHETQNFECAQLRPYSCGAKCGRLLRCGHHFCQLECHDVINAEASDKAGDSCTTCDRKCTQPRPDGCTHHCLLTCHDKPCPACKLMIKMRCHCSSVQKYIACNQWTVADEPGKDKLRMCGGPCPKKLSCEHVCSLYCHPGDCSKPENCQAKITQKCQCRRRKKDFVCKDVRFGNMKLECDDVCEQQKAKKQKEREAEQKKKKDEELKKQQADLEEYERKMRGRKRKPRKEHIREEKPSFFKRYGLYIVMLLSIIVAIVAVIYVKSN